jgi:hypothetical protein
MLKISPTKLVNIVLLVLILVLSVGFLNTNPVFA